MNVPLPQRELNRNRNLGCCCCAHPERKPCLQANVLADEIRAERWKNEGQARSLLSKSPSGARAAEIDSLSDRLFRAARHALADREEYDEGKTTPAIYEVRDWAGLALVMRAKSEFVRAMLDLYARLRDAERPPHQKPLSLPEMRETA